MGSLFPNALPIHEARDWLLRSIESQAPLWAFTSGSTGNPKCVQISGKALGASVDATMRVLQKEVSPSPESRVNSATWLLTLPLSHIAGWLVVARAALTDGALLEVAGTARGEAAPFTPDAFCIAAQQAATQGPWHTALVPTQLHRIVSSSKALTLLATAESVLIGGASIAPSLVDQASAAGVNLRRTYGMTETCGGCVYDGHPLPGATLGIGSDSHPPGVDTSSADSSTSGLIWVSGPMLADGYVCSQTKELAPESGANAVFVTDQNGQRWHRSNDIGRLADDGSLQVLGRADDVINSGGLKIAPLPLEKAARTVAEITDACVVGVPDQHWGEVVVAVVELSQGCTWTQATYDDVMEAFEQACPRSHLPKKVLTRELPRRGIGKVDRQAVQRWAAAHT